MSSRSQILQQAKLQAALQFAPQIGALHDQASQANSDLATGIAAQAAAATAIVAQAKSARRPTKRTYDAQIHTDRTTNAQVSGDLAKLGPATDSFRAAADREEAAAGAATTTGRTNALGALSDEATSATAGRAYAVANLLAQRNKTTSDIGSKLSDLAAQRGAATSSDYMTLLDKADSRSLDRAKFNETVRHDRATEGKGKGHGGLTPTQVRASTSKAKDAIREAQTWLGRGTPESILQTGGSVPHNVPLTDPATGKPQTDTRGQVKVQKLTIKVPKIPAVYLRAAKELNSATGHLSQDTVHELRTRGVHVPAGWLPKPFTITGTGRPPGQRPT